MVHLFIPLGSSERRKMLSYRLRRVIFITLSALVIFTAVQIIRPNHVIDVQDRAAQLKQIAKMIQSGGKNKLWKGGQACKHPHLEVDNPDILKFIKHQPPLECSPEKDWIEISGSTAYITQEAKDKYGEIECSFTDIIRTDDFSTRAGITTTTHTEYNLEASDFVRVRCVSNSGHKWSSIMAGVRNDQDVLDHSGWHLVPPDGLGLNVLMFGFDSLSHNTFIRKLPKSYAYL